MKKIMFLISILLLALSAFAKGGVGIYISQQDYLAHSIAYGAVPGSHTRTRIRVENVTCNTPYVVLSENGRHTRLNKAGLYGYTDRSGRTYRFYKNREYCIVAADSIFIYTRCEDQLLPKGFRTITAYYFSRSAGGDILPLSLSNINNAFSDCPAFLRSLYEQLNNNYSLTTFYPLSHSFMLNYLFSRYNTIAQPFSAIK